MTLQSSQRLPELLFYTKKSYKILQAPIPAPIPAPILHVHNSENSPSRIHSTCRRQRALRVLQSSSRNSTHRRQGDLLEIHPCVLHDIPVTPVAPETFRTFQSFMTFQPSRQFYKFYNVPVSPGNSPHSSILRLECIFYNSTISTVRLVSTETPPSTSWATTDITNIHSSKKGRCCDIGQIDRFSIIELFPLSSCQVIILIARMTFNCSTSCLMS